MKAYLLMDLCYAASHMLATQQDGIVRPFLLAELPTVRADRLFGAPMRLPSFIWTVIGIALTVHVYWFSRWVATQQRRNAATD